VPTGRARSRKCYSSIAEAAPRILQKYIVIDGAARILGVHRTPNFGVLKFFP